MKKFTVWIKKHKKLAVFLCIAIIIAAAVLTIRHKAQAAMAQLAELTEETAVVEKRSIQSSVSSTGTIISDKTRSITATLTGMEVLSVDVEVGDVVQEGDTICTFDTSKLEDNLEDAEKSLSAAKTQTSVTVNNAKRALEQAVETQNYQIESAARNVISAGEAYNSAREAYDEAQSKADEAYDEMRSAKKKLDELSYSDADYKTTQAYSDYQAKLEAYNIAVQENNSIKADPNSTAEQLNEASAKEINAAAELNAAEAALKATPEYNQTAANEKAKAEAEANYKSAKATYDSLDSSMSNLESALRNAKTALDNAQATYEYTVSSQQNQYEGSRDNLKSARASAGVATQQQENAVDTYQEQIEKGTLKAGISGTVTAINVKQGDTYAGGVIATIQDCSAFVVSAEIDEYDIADVKLGMKAVFKTDATRDEQLQGEVIFISPTPTQGSNVTYQVKVKINSPTDRLRLGMNAKLNIILRETADVLTVPYDAVQQDENGNDVVYVVTRTESGGITKAAVPVTVGVEGDYYVEVTGDIQEGMEVSMPSDMKFDFSQMMAMGS